jgi:molybdopterin molybdotransferase
VAALSFSDARRTVLGTVTASRTPPPVEDIPLLNAVGRVLAVPAFAPHDLPPLARSVRDGFAVRSSDLPGRLKQVGEIPAGSPPGPPLLPGQAIAIMTGAAVPDGADAVVMVEHVRREGDLVLVDSPAVPGQFINPRGCEAAAGSSLLSPGKRLDYTDIALLASIGQARVSVYRLPTVAIVPTGDELVEIDRTPLDYQIRNSNAYALAAQVARAGGIPQVLPIARDTMESTRAAIAQALTADFVLLSGGVSAGTRDFVEPALAEFGAEFFFDRVLIQPGQPVVFGRAQGKFFFGLPGNPSSTMVTFEVFARAALELLAGQTESALHIPLARLTRDFKHRAGITRFLPAHLAAGSPEVTPVAWSGSGDIPALTRANAFLVAEPDRPNYTSGDLIGVLLK